MEDLKILTKADFSDFYEILRSSFPPDELRSRQEHLALLDRPDYKIYARYEKDRLAGFLTVWQLEDFAFVEHFAVHRQMRNCGLGSRLLEMLKQRLGTRLCLEAELPLTEMAGRRIGFYQRNGFYKNDYPYMQPALEPGKAPVPLCIMTTCGPIDEKTFEKLKHQLYTIVYQGKL